MKVLVTGGTGFIGSTVTAKLKEKGYQVSSIGKDYCDFTGNMDNIVSMLEFEKPDAVIMCHGLIKGIVGNKKTPYQMITENLRMNSNFIEACRIARIERVLYLFGGCSYPSHAKNPIREEDLFTGLPDENSKYYSLGKAVNHLQIVAARKEYGFDWSSCIPGNCYGQNDNFSLEDSHVIPAMIRKFHEAKIRGDSSISLFGNGFPIRDFIFVEDAAEGIVLAMEKHHGELPINISSGKGISIKETAEMIKEIVGFNGEIKWDISQTGGQICKIFEVERAERILEFEAKTSLKEGIRITYKWFCTNMETGKVRL